MTTGLGGKRESLGVMPALIVYLGLDLLHVPPFVTLGAGLATAAAGVVWLRHRGRLNRTALLSAILFAVIATAVSVTGDLWLFLLKPVVTALLLGALIVTNRRRGARPFSLSILCRLRPRRREQLLRQYDSDPGVRRRHRTVTRVWGIAIIADGVIRIAALLTLPPWLAVVTSMPLTIVAVAVGTTLSLRYLSSSTDQPDFSPTP